MSTANRRISLISRLWIVSYLVRVREMSSWYEPELNVDLNTIYCIGQVFFFFLFESDHRNRHSQSISCSNVLHNLESGSRILFRRHIFHCVLEGSKLCDPLSSKAVFWNSRTPHDFVFDFLSFCKGGEVELSEEVDCSTNHSTTSNGMSYKDRTCILMGISSVLNQVNLSYSEQVRSNSV